MSRWKAALSVLGGGFAVFGACQTPTSVTFVVRTDVDCSQTTPVRPLTHVVFGQPGAVESAESLQQPASTKECALTSGALAELGSVVALPREDENAPLAMVAVLGVQRPTEACGVVPDDEGELWGGCIVARRRLGFVEGESLEVDVPLYFSCVGVPCDAFSTCVPERGCVSSEIDPNTCIDARCGEGELEGGTTVGASASASSGDASSSTSSGDPSSSASSGNASSGASSGDASSSVSAGGGDGGASVTSGGGGGGDVTSAGGDGGDPTSGGGDGGMSQGGGGSTSSNGGGGSTSSNGGGGSTSSNGGGGSTSSNGGGGSTSSNGGGGSTSSNGGGGSTSSNGGGGGTVVTPI